MSKMIECLEKKQTLLTHLFNCTEKTMQLTEQSINSAKIRNK